ncbi:uncharacterized protein AMSG_09710 [Thecamonas trahens ATCC 50062]|uniref:AAA+ ATPase domain-containing protein n=1 Tax=Thecamonas trahens ATCC 50062 TaxID=461836 RepID=A0A0L0DRH5_THETB|nr:hypothetical protein AMSG_09710 [Thecamonas trahens ATCC 50062]KNC54048.1 hypothetical protein AMSG_09710 [Thecamonas trahens ATCC 50062]|eukprot:XP_013754059.1 hypothetical protein AMSG_09710 [Thecamonas trahens ATCC 50062]
MHPRARARKAELVPSGYASEQIGEQHGNVLEWMIQKELLAQDVFVLGDAGSMRRELVLAYCELAEREVEYMPISRDTTESDLKQRREIAGGSIAYVDQAAVRAAKAGRVLVLDGIEKAERNVMPILNNLLENREMNLESGELLIAPEKYDALEAQHGKEALDKWGLIRVHEDFRVMVLGLPVPPYEGNRLDPPFRSRFQATALPPPSADELLSLAHGLAPSVPLDVTRSVVGFALAAHAASAPGKAAAHTKAAGDKPRSPLPLGFPFYPGLARTFNTLEAVASQAPAVVPHLVTPLMDATFPWREALKASSPASASEAASAMSVAAARFNLKGASKAASDLAVRRLSEASAPGFAAFEFEHPATNSRFVLEAPVGTRAADTFMASDAAHDSSAVAHIVLALATGVDAAVVGGRGVGKSHAAKSVAALLGVDLEVLPMYKDMSTRDLLMRRTTSVEGNTAWEPTPLVLAALDGSLCVLDGIDRIDPGSLAVLQSLLHHRSATLPNGLRLVHPDAPEALVRDPTEVERLLRAADASEAAPLPVHPAFRVLGLGLPPASGAPWLNSEAATLFRTHVLPPRSQAQFEELLAALFPSLEAASLQRITSPRLGLSLRQAIHVAKRVESHPADERNAVERTLLVAFLPSVEREVKTEVLDEVFGASPIKAADDAPVRIAVTPDAVTIGDVSAPRRVGADPTLVPQIGHRFADIPAHTAVLESLLKDYSAGESLLLIGPQGVGKNMLCDRFLELLNAPRQYIQLHRDSSVMSLTSNPSFEGGVLSWGDSPLVKAAIHGHVLVVDEADKAPLEVVAVLKSLIEDAHMLLPDGRKLVAPEVAAALGSNAGLVPISPDFRVIVLANKPGFPFLGNDFYRECGDLFAVHSIDNPDAASELMMLQAHAKGVDDALLKSLTAAFRDLRASVDAGHLSYPYSSRELVAIVRHASKFPSSGLAGALHNVFDFDAHDPAVLALLASTFRAHGLPLGVTPQFRTAVAPAVPLGEPLEVASWAKVPGSTVSVEATQVELEADAEFDWEAPSPVACTDDGGRPGLDANIFNEHVGTTRVPSRGQPVAVATGGDGGVHVVGSSPEMLFSYSADRRSYTTLDLFASSGGDGFGGAGRYVPNIEIAALPRDQKIFLAYQGEGLLLDLAARRGQRFELPAGTVGGHAQINAMASSFSIWGQSTGGKRSRLDEELVVNAALAEELSALVLYSPRGDLIHLLYANNVLETVTLPKGTELAAVDPISPLVYLLTLDNGQRALLEGDRATPGFAKFSLLRGSGASELRVASKVGAPKVVAAGGEVMAAIDDGALSASEGSAESGKMLGWMRSEHAGAGRTVVASVHCRASGENEDQAFVADRGSDGNVVNVLACEEPGTYELEVVDLGAHTVRRFGFDARSGMMAAMVEAESATGASGLRSSRSAPSVVDAVELPHGCVGVQMTDGAMYVFKVDALALEAELARWQGFAGKGEGGRRARRVEKKRTRHRSPTAPKHGKIDPDNTPHVGGNQWHGGTGGADTAGLGGVGGPYRVDAGHNVHQVPDSVKAELDAETAAAARAMGEAALAERLKEIEMSHHEAGLYDRYRSSVATPIRELEVLLSSLEAKNKERAWLSHQSTGDLDEAKLVEGLTGETNVYKRRGKATSLPSAAQRKPKKMSFVLDCSGSMYRFNGLDGRLERLLVCSLMIMEGLAPGVAAGTLQYSIVGHSGGSPAIPLVSYDAPPANEAERLRVLQTMAAHSQFCPSGDHTVEAAQLAMDAMAEEDADEKFVFVVSDANLARYGIPASALGNALASPDSDDIAGYAVMVASFGDEASDIVAAVGPGRGFVCSDPAELVDVFREVVKSTL